MLIFCIFWHFSGLKMTPKYLHVGVEHQVSCKCMSHRWRRDSVCVLVQKESLIFWPLYDSCKRSTWRIWAFTKWVETGSALSLIENSRPNEDNRQSHKITRWPRRFPLWTEHSREAAILEDENHVKWSTKPQTLMGRLGSLWTGLVFRALVCAERFCS